MQEQDDLKRELKRLAERLERVERLLHIESQVVPPPLPTSPPRAPVDEKTAAFRRLQTNWQDERQTAPAPPTAPTPLPRPMTLPPLASPPVTATAPPVHPAPSPIAVPPRAVPPTRAASKGEGGGLEMLIGGKWLAWVGALTVVLAAAFAVMVAVNEGWWGRLTPLTRCLAIAGFGGLLLVGGELALRRIGKAASVGLFGAGLGTLYLDSYAAFKPFALVSGVQAFPLLGAVALLGFAITVRTRFLTIGVLSLIGGYLAPLLLWENATHELRLPLYLTMLFGVALGLSAFRPKPFRALRYVAIAGQLLIGLIWIIDEGRVMWKPAMVFMTIWSAMVLAEVIYAALREQSVVGNVVLSLIGTASFVTAGCWLLNQYQPPGLNWMGAFTLAAGLLNAAAAAQFGPGLDGLRGRAISAMDKLAIALWIQAGALLAVAIGLHFDGFGQSVGWLAVGLASIEIGRRLPSRGVTIFGLIVGALAVARVAALDWLPANMHIPLWIFGEVTVNRWSILALATILAIHVAAQRIQQRPQASGEIMPAFLAAIGTIFWMVLCAIQCHGLTATAGWLLGVVILLTLERTGRRQWYFEIALLALVATAGRWLIVDAALARMSPNWNALQTLPLFNWQMALAAAIAAAGFWVYRLLRMREKQVIEDDAAPLASRQTWQIILMLGAIFGLVALSFETDHLVKRLAALSSNLWWSVGHLRQLLLTLLWTFGSTGIGLLAIAMRQRDERGGSHVPVLLIRFAWIILGICATKWVIGDTLFWVVVSNRAQTTGSLPIANVQMLVGFTLAAAAIVLTAAGAARSILSHPWDEDATLVLQASMNLGQWIPVFASLLLLWGLSFEVDRALARIAHPAAWLSVWDPAQLRGLWWTALWGAGGVVMALVGRARKMPGMVLGGWGVTATAALAWLSFDTLVFRFQSGIAPAMVVVNLQFAVGVAAALFLIASVILARGYFIGISSDDHTRVIRDLRMSLALIIAIGLWLGTLEIDRHFADQLMEKQAGFSVFWGLSGVLLVLIGFFKRSAALRYVGLALLAITLGKAFIIDLREVALIWKTVIFAVVGLLLIATSMVYIRLAPRLLGNGQSRDEIESGN